MFLSLSLLLNSRNQALALSDYLSRSLEDSLEEIRLAFHRKEPPKRANWKKVAKYIPPKQNQIIRNPLKQIQRFDSNETALSVSSDSKVLRIPFSVEGWQGEGFLRSVDSVRFQLGTSKSSASSRESIWCWSNCWLQHYWTKSTARSSRWSLSLRPQTKSNSEVQRGPSKLDDRSNSLNSIFFLAD